MAALPGWNPEDYEIHRIALGYLNARTTVSPETADEYIFSILKEAADPYDDMARLFGAMGSIAGLLVTMRIAEMDISAATTFEQLGRIITPPSE